MTSMITDAMVQAFCEEAGISLDEERSEYVPSWTKQDVVAALEAALSRLPASGNESLLRGIVAAWESLPQGQYSGRDGMRQIEEWLRNEMKPAIDRIRSSLVSPAEGREPVGYLFDLRYSGDTWSRQKMYSECLPKEGDYRNAVALYAHPLPVADGWRTPGPVPNEAVWTVRDSISRQTGWHVSELAIRAALEGVWPRQPDPEAIASFLDALEEWGCEDNGERATTILSFIADGCNLSAYEESQPTSPLTEPQQSQEMEK